ncbi:23S rRNA (adenine(2030)-N(6))-methyltransferase RlmJ [Nitratireductor sp. CH_MIT9313-5]|uniref:23S rRNA (adenine(2030)-N(6))-methyltransferase RlmJ n=1 Tax=Nitratireductor sp. CH_MIT9313-5 TaxID=3107764 RepID=UPI00300A8CFE
MNYRHAFHAGNFADVVKHAILTRIIAYLQRKDKAFRVVDTHAGLGIYDLSSDEAQRTGEWQGGIGRIRNSDIRKKTNLLNPLLEAVEALNQGDEISHYPGSPFVTRHLLRKQDRLTAIELHEADAEVLAQNFEGDHQVRVIHLDGWLALGAHLPPKEKRGLVLVDPPFEKEGEFERMVAGLEKAHKRWPGGIYAFWYPIKNREAVAQFHQDLRDSGIGDIIDVQLSVRDESSEPRFDGTGMVVVNPPYLLESELNELLPLLHDALSEGSKGGYSVTRLADEANT